MGGGLRWLCFFDRSWFGLALFYRGGLSTFPLLGLSVWFSVDIPLFLISFLFRLFPYNFFLTQFFVPFFFKHLLFFLNRFRLFQFFLEQSKFLSQEFLLILGLIVFGLRAELRWVVCNFYYNSGLLLRRDFLNLGGLFHRRLRFLWCFLIDNYGGGRIDLFKGRWLYRLVCRWLRRFGCGHTPWVDVHQQILLVWSYETCKNISCSSTLCLSLSTSARRTTKLMIYYLFSH